MLIPIIRATKSNPKISLPKTTQKIGITLITKAMMMKVTMTKTTIVILENASQMHREEDPTKIPILQKRNSKPDQNLIKAKPTIFGPRIAKFGRMETLI